MENSVEKFFRQNYASIFSVFFGVDKSNRLRCNRNASQLEPEWISQCLAWIYIENSRTKYREWILLPCCFLVVMMMLLLCWKLFSILSLILRRNNFRCILLLLVGWLVSRNLVCRRLRLVFMKSTNKFYFRIAANDGNVYRLVYHFFFFFIFDFRLSQIMIEDLL